MILTVFVMFDHVIALVGVVGLQKYAHSEWYMWQSTSPAQLN